MNNQNIFTKLLYCCDSEEMQQRQWQSITILAALFISASLIVTELCRLHKQPGMVGLQSFLYLGFVLLFVVIALCIYRSNKTEYKPFTSHPLLIITIAVVTMAVYENPLGQSTILYALPVVMASLLISPNSSFAYAAISSVAYSIVFFLLRDQTQVTLPILSLFGIFVLATVSWLLTKHINLINNNCKKALRKNEERIRKIIDNIPDGVIIVENGAIVYLNTRICEITGYEDTELLEISIFDIATSEEKENLPVSYSQVCESKQLPQEHIYWINRKDNTRRCIRNRYTILTANNQSITLFIITTDITEQKIQKIELESVARISRSLRSIQSRQDIYSVLLEQSCSLLNCGSALIAIINDKNGKLEVQQAFGGWSRLHGIHIDLGESIIKQVVETGDITMCDDIRKVPFLDRMDLVDRDFASAAVSIATQSKPFGVLVVGRDKSFTQEEIQALTALAEVAASSLHRTHLYENSQRQMEQMKIVDSINRSLTETLLLSEIYARLEQGIKELYNEVSAILISRYDPSNRLITCAYASNEGKLVDISQFPPIPISPPGHGPQSEAILSRFPIITNNLDARLETAFVNIFIGKEPSPRSAIYAPLISKGQVMGVLQVQSYLPMNFTQTDAEMLALVAHAVASAIDTAELFNETQQRLKRLTSLRTIDMAINASMDLRVTLNILLEQIVSQLSVDAASILLYNEKTHLLNYAAQYALRSNQIPNESIRLGQGLAGRAALERQTISIPNLQDTGYDDIPEYWLTVENFLACWASPLIAKGQIKGVMLIFHRTAIDPDPEWIDFLETLAGQAAIAIDNATMYSDLQRSNLELMLAYDTTLEGWSHALDLRDHDTEGHTQRVAELSTRLAQVMKLTDDELIQVRRGALLHDIGKLGVPDHILHKPGPLSEQEQEIMRRHPEYAHEMLSSIDFLAPAIDIPYCHHEKWDGSGYPRGLSGDQIPLAARIFAIADVWDSIRSDRPYRTAWSIEESLAHICQESGKYFDPLIVKIFIESEIWK